MITDLSWTRGRYSTLLELRSYVSQQIPKKEGNKGGGGNKKVVENIILVKNEYQIPIRHAKNTPMPWVLQWKHPWCSPTPTDIVLLCFRGQVLCFSYFTSFLRASKGPFACVNCPFYLPGIFSIRTQNTPFTYAKSR